MSVAETKLRTLIQRAPRSADDLIQFLHEGLDWPLPPDFAWADIHIDWNPDELHLDPTKVARLKQISQLPPLTKDQRFGVFVLGFEDGQLPVGAIRRLLDRLVRNERARKGRGTHPQFALNDLLFFCLSDGSQKVLHLVNFREAEGKRVLRTVSWSKDVTDARLDLIVKRSVPDLAWTNANGPRIAVDPDALGGFGRYREPIKNAATLASRMADVARDVKSEVLALHQVETEDGPIRSLHEEIRAELIADLTPERFADVYAQTMVYGLLTARIAHPEAFRKGDAAALIEFENPLLNAIYTRFRQDSEDQVDLDELGLADLSAQLGATDVEAVLAEFGATNKREDPVVHFYEEFLARYDPKARISAGAFYTPLPVVRYLVRAVDSILKDTFGLPLGVADAGTWGQVCGHLGIDVPKGINPKARFISMLDPATGTGTFLVEWVHQAERSFKATYPRGDWPAHLSDVVFPGMHAFELMLAPYAIAHLRIALAAKEYGVEAPRLTILLTDSLDHPSDQSMLGEFDDPVAAEGERANELKANSRFTIVIGNPPYERGGRNRFDSDDRPKGGVVTEGRPGLPALLDTLVTLMRNYGEGRQAKNLYNDYVYFWRWAMWRTTERPPGPGITAFITPRSFIDGRGVSGLRGQMRKDFDEIVVVDLGGDGRVADGDENVFDILTPVAIAIGVNKGGQLGTGADIAHVEVAGDRSAKFDWLESHGVDRGLFTAAPGSGLDPFTPVDDGAYFTWPSISTLFPWSARGIQFSRTWPIGVAPGLLEARWRALVEASADRKRLLLKESRDAQIDRDYPSFLGAGRLKPIASLSQSAQPEAIRGVGFRSFDRQWCIADRRVIDMPRPPLWQVASEDQTYLCILASGKDYTVGPVMTAHTSVPDLNAFRGAGGGLVLPVWRDESATTANVDPAVIAKLRDNLGSGFRPDDVAAYVYALLGTGAFRERFAADLAKQIDPVRIPLTKDAELFQATVTLGRELLWWHTWGERFDEPNDSPGSAEVISAVTGMPMSVSYDKDAGEIIVGTGRFGPVASEVWDFEVSGLKVVQAWLGNRTAAGKGKKSSPLDDIRQTEWTFSDDFLLLLHAIEFTVDQTPVAAQLLEKIVGGPVFSASELFHTRDAERKPPE